MFHTEKGNEIKVIQDLILEDLPRPMQGRFLLDLVRDGMGLPIQIPILVAKGVEDGPVIGLTAAVHGNELNGIPVIQRVFKELDVRHLKGTVVGVLVLNVPSLLRKRRRFIDNTDLNHIFPGKADGNVSQVYAYRIMDRIVRHFDYLMDLHTASFGRVNSYYIRADMEDPQTREMALLQNASIIVHNRPRDGSLRGAASELGIHAITLEVGDPNKFQKGMIRSGLTGMFNLFASLGMIADKVEPPEKPPVTCRDSYWLYTDTGGILNVPPELTQVVKKGQVVATMRNIFGDLVREYLAPEKGVVIGKSTAPINQTGGRILHLGLLD